MKTTKSRSVSGDISTRHVRRQKKRKRLTVFGRIAVFFVFALIASTIIMFFTPVFNIKAIEVEGNSKIDSQTVIAQSGIVEGENLFKVNVSQMKKSLATIAYIDDVSVDRQLFPPTFKIIVTEAEPKAYAEVGEKYVLIDKKCKVLEETVNISVAIPEIVGLNLQKYSIGNKLEIDESEKTDIIVLCIDKIDELGLIADVNSISVEDTNRITFKYQNRLTVICGSKLDLDDKLVFFDNIIKSDRLEDNSRGTVDLSTKGKAVYTP